MGHTACGAIKGAIDNVQLGNLTGLLAKIHQRWPRRNTKASDRPRTMISWTRLPEKTSS
jgi:carbonic anhydrase